MITLEISSTDIRLIEVEEGRVIKWASHSLEPGIFEQESLLDARALGAVVRQLMTSSGIKGRDVIASVSGLYSLNRIVIVSGPSGRVITQQAVLEAADEVISLPEDEFYLSWQTISTIEGGQNQVLVVGVPRDVVDSEVRALRAVGINPRVLDLKAMALARAVNREQALILNIETTSFDMVVVANGVVEVMRTIAWQTNDLSMEDKAEHLGVTLELTIGFHNSHHPGFPLDLATPLFITGQMSGDLSLIERLKDRIGYPIEPLAPSLECPADLPISQYAVNIGLALKGTASSQNLSQSGYSPLDMNLLPQVYRPWKPSAKQIYFFCAVVAVIALLFPFYGVTSEAIDKTANLKARYTVANTALERRKVQLALRDPLQAAINEYQAIINMGGGFSEDLEVIKSIAEELGIELGSISHTGSSLTFTCQADSYLIFRDYVTALEESGRFSSVTSPAERPKHPPEYIKGGIITLTPKTVE
ncbi:pilus assembly protein PilM [Chloroflexota bacterium]